MAESPNCSGGEDRSEARNTKSGILRLASLGKRKCFLFRDVLILARIATELDEPSSSQRKITFKNERIIDLARSNIAADENDGTKFTLKIESETLEFFAESEQERNEWVSNIQRAAESQKLARNKLGDDESSEKDLACSQCDQRFGPNSKSHICRKCGKFVCEACSAKSVRFSEKEEPTRFCDHCFSHFVDKTTGYRSVVSSGKSKHRRAESLPENSPEFTLKKGYLKKYAGIKGWKSRWFVLKNNTLSHYENEASEGKQPLQVIDLGTLVRMNNLPRYSEGFVIVAGDKTHEMLAESVTEKNEWMAAIKQSLSLLPALDQSVDLHRLQTEQDKPMIKRLASAPNIEIKKHVQDLSYSPPQPSFLPMGETSMPLFHSDGEQQELQSTDEETVPDGTLSPPEMADDEFPWVHPTKEKQFMSDWAIVEDWLQDITTNVKMNNEVLKTEVKKALGRLKKESSKPFANLGNDLKKFNDRLLRVGKKDELTVPTREAVGPLTPPDEKAENVEGSEVKEESEQSEGSTEPQNGEPPSPTGLSQTVPSTSTAPSVPSVPTTLPTPTAPVFPTLTVATTPTIPTTPTTPTIPSTPTVVPAQKEEYPKEEVTCGCQDHYDTKVFEQIVPLPVDKLFDALYSENSSFMANYNHKRAVKDYEETNTEMGKFGEIEHWLKRNVRYYLFVKNPLAKNPYALTIENQTILTLEPKARYIVDVETCNPEVIYGDTFDVITRYCFTFVSPTTSRMVAHVKLVWKKQTMLKVMIFKLATGAIKEVIKDLVESLSNTKLLPKEQSPHSPEIEKPQKVEPSQQSTNQQLSTPTPKNETPPSPLPTAIPTSSIAPTPIHSNGLASASAPALTLPHAKLLPAESSSPLPFWGVQIFILTSLILLVALFRLTFDPQTLILRISFAIRSATLASAPLPLTLYISKQPEISPLLLSLGLFFVLNTICLSTFEDMSNQMSVIMIFSLYHLAGSSFLLAMAATSKPISKTSTGVVLCFLTGALAFTVNLVLLVCGS